MTTTASGLGFAGGGDGVLRAFDTKTGKILWKFQTGHQIAAGPTVFTDNGKEYVAVTVGGTPTSSGRRRLLAAPGLHARRLQDAIAPAAVVVQSPAVGGCSSHLTAPRADDAAATRQPDDGQVGRCADRDAGPVRRADLERPASEHTGRQRNAPAWWQAGTRRGDGGRQLHAAQPHECTRTVLLPAGHRRCRAGTSFACCRALRRRRSAGGR